YGEDQAHTFAARLYPQGYRYRDWVIESFNHDKPYDQFAIEQIAGDLLPSDALEGKFARLPALGFFALGPVYYADAGCAPKAQADEWDDRIDTLTRGFLGLTVSCARCHDHKFDPVSMHDYYALAGIFASSRYDETPLVPADIVQAFNAATARVKDQEKAVSDTQTAEVRKLSESWVPQVANYLAAAWHVQNRRKVEANFAAASVAKERQLHDFVLEAWLKLLTPEYVGQRPWLAEWKKLLDSQDAKIDLSGDEAAVAAVRMVAEQIQSQAVAALTIRAQLDAEYDAAIAQAANEEAKKKVAKKQLEKADAELLKDLLTEGKSPFNAPKDRAEKLFDEAAKGRIAEAKSKLEQLKREVPPKYPFVHGLADGDAKNLKIHLRGNHTTLGDEAPRKFLAVLSPDNASPFSQGSGRLELAKSIGSDSNPLTARVFVNRVWQQMLGRGLVGTPSNFGLLGERPT
ncbi:MAG TPA: DUF1549 domain-containing protein, partial [Pirellulaceae bacterium]|nr:DUF1549 domain-containing protein [Pirellulaceae bacterium]